MSLIGSTVSVASTRIILVTITQLKRWFLMLIMFNRQHRSEWAEASTDHFWVSSKRPVLQCPDPKVQSRRQWPNILRWLHPAFGYAADFNWSIPPSWHWSIRLHSNQLRAVPYAGVRSRYKGLKEPHFQAPRSPAFLTVTVFLVINALHLCLSNISSHLILSQPSQFAIVPTSLFTKNFNTILPLSEPRWPMNVWANQARSTPACNSFNLNTTIS